jgi:hypothetical protein
MLEGSAATPSASASSIRALLTPAQYAQELQRVQSNETSLMQDRKDCPILGVEYQSPNSYTRVGLWSIMTVPIYVELIRGGVWFLFAIGAGLYFLAGALMLIAAVVSESSTVPFWLGSLIGSAAIVWLSNTMSKEHFQKAWEREQEPHGKNPSG